MQSKVKLRPVPNPRLMGQVRQVMRCHQNIYRTERAYGDGILRNIRFYHYRRRLKDMGKAEIFQLGHRNPKRNGVESLFVKMHVPPDFRAG